MVARSREARSRRAVYPGSFDPVTFGHLDVIRRASRLFDEVIVAVLDNTTKTPWFDTAERVALLEHEIRSFENVRVGAFSGLLVDFARRVGAATVVRGVRGSADLDSEVAMARTNRALSPSLDTVFMAAAPETSHVASRLVREIALLGGSVDVLAPPRVAKRVRERAAALRTLQGPRVS